MARKFLGGKPTVGTTDVPVVVESRTITATAPVTIAGTTSADLSADRTIAVSAASTSAAGVVQLSDSYTTTGSTKAATETAVKAAYDAAIPKSLVDAKGDLIGASADNTPARVGPVGANGTALVADSTATPGVAWSTTINGTAIPSTATLVTTTRSVSTTLPLTGGGDLSANRTLDINNFTGDSGSGGAKGTVPAPAAGDAAAGKFLKADGTWAAPSSSGGSAKQEAFGSITSTSGTIDYNYTTATTFYHTSSPTADWTVNFTNVPTDNNYAYNFTIVVPQGATAYKVSAAQIAGSSATIKWAGSTAAPAGNNSKTDIWVFSLFRVSGAWTVLGVQSANFG